MAPGLAIVLAGPKALERRKSLGSIKDYYVDFEKWAPIMEDPSKYFGTPPVNLIWALKESLRIIKEEGVENRYEETYKGSKGYAGCPRGIRIYPIGREGI